MSAGIEPRDSSYWVGYLGSALAAISRVASLREAKSLSRQGLLAVTDPLEGLPELDEATKQSWREEASRKGEDA